VLKQNQQAVSEYFAKREHNAETEQRLGIHFSADTSGAPVIDGTLAPDELQGDCGRNVGWRPYDFYREVEEQNCRGRAACCISAEEYRKIARTTPSVRDSRKAASIRGVAQFPLRCFSLAQSVNGLFCDS